MDGANEDFFFTPDTKAWEWHSRITLNSLNQMHSTIFYINYSEELKYAVE